MLRKLIIVPSNLTIMPLKPIACRFHRCCRASKKSRNGAGINLLLAQIFSKKQKGLRVASRISYVEPKWLRRRP